jgi:nitrile hydratase
MGLDLADDVEIRLWDSTAEIRYLVLPERPPGTEGMTMDALAALITRDAMIGVARVEPGDEHRAPSTPASRDRE